MKKLVRTFALVAALGVGVAATACTSPVAPENDIDWGSGSDIDWGSGSDIDWGSGSDIDWGSGSDIDWGSGS